MAWPINGGDILQLTHWQKLDGQTLLNIMHYRISGSLVTIADGATALSDFLTGYAASGTSVYGKIKACQATSVAHEKITAQIIWPVRRPFVVKDTGDSGARVGTAMPTGCAACITKRQDVAGRGKTGRMEVGGYLVTDVEDSQITNTLADLLIELAESMEAKLSLGAQTNVLIPAIYNKAQPANTGDIDTTSINYTVRYLTRRTVGRGI